jgi:hypothetical protein
MSQVTNDSGSNVDELEREVDQTRAKVANTLDELQSQVTETLDDWRARLTAEQITAELKTYARESGRRLVSNVTESIKTRFRENPASAVAMGAAAAWPVLKLARKIPLPVYVVGAGVALMKPLADAYGRSDQRTNGHAHGHNGYRGYDTGYEEPSTMDRVKESVAEGAAQAADAAERAKDAVVSGVSHAASEMSEAANRTMHSAADMTSSAAHRAAEISRGVANPWVLGSLGLAIGAALAATSIPRAGHDGRVRSRTAQRGRDAATPERHRGARAAVNRAYWVARTEAEDAGLSAEDADIVARSFVLRMAGQGPGEDRRYS